jgi:Leucine-rich repeat (LRR) protein
MHNNKQRHINVLWKYMIFSIVIINTYKIPIGVNCTASILGFDTLDTTRGGTITITDSVMCDLVLSTSLGSNLDVNGWRCGGGLPLSDTCNWTGVTCESSNVVSININSTSISGTLPASIGDMTSLTSLQFGTNELSGNIPTEIGKLTNLVILSLYNNKLNGTIPTSIGDMINLQWLDLSYNNITGSIPYEIGELTLLEVLYLQSNILNGIIPVTINDMVSLYDVQFQSNCLSGHLPFNNYIYNNITNYTNIQNWTMFDDDYNNSSNITNFNNTLNWTLNTTNSTIFVNSSLPYLTIFYAHDNNLNGTIPTSMGDMTSLIDLQLHSNSLTGSVPNEFTMLTNLTDLQLQDNNLNGIYSSGLCSMSQLTTFYITQSEYNEYDLQYVAMCDLAASTSLGNSSDVDGWRCSDRLPLISECDWTGIDCDDIWVTSINMYNMSVTGTLPTSIGYLYSLQYLAFEYNSLSGSIPSEIGKLTKLVILSLYNNKLNSTIPATIGKLVNLNVTHLGYNYFSGSIPSEIGKLEKILNFHIFNNKLSGNLLVT